MAINSIGSSASNTLQAIQSRVEAPMIATGEKENDGDSDDMKVNAPPPPRPLPSVNTSGQITGQIINIKA